MRKLLMMIPVLFFAFAQGQESRPLPQITVNGEGKVRAVPDQAIISVAVETKGADATTVKKQNDAAVEKVVQFIRRYNLPKEDVQTQRVSLNPQYDYDKKKYSYIANQTIEILLKDLDKYDALMEGLTNSGINRINKVEFQSSKMEAHQSDARKLAMQQALRKAQDYVGVIGQKVGKAYMINDNSQVSYPRAMYMADMKVQTSGEEMARETLAIGEIDITANVTVSFILE
ncbi:MAG: SIMPL domain-containing protein [Flavobacterium sp.]|nr:SIMPL domain-containing protein [Flavobacterium sp.]